MAALLRTAARAVVATKRRVRAGINKVRHIKAGKPYISPAVYLNPVGAVGGGLTLGTKTGRKMVVWGIRRARKSKYVHARGAGEGMQSLLRQTRPTYLALRKWMRRR